MKKLSSRDGEPLHPLPDSACSDTRPRVIFGADHNAAGQIDRLAGAIGAFGDLIDVVALDPTLQDYVSISARVCDIVRTENAMGVIVCGTGIGISIVANKYPGIYAARCTSPLDAEDCRRINNANVLCLSAKISVDENTVIIERFFQTHFDTDERRIQRQRKIQFIEGENFADKNALPGRR